MKKFIKSKSILQIALTSFIAALAVVGIVTAATTIGTNITTTGTLSVTGTTTFRSIDYLWPSADGSSGQFLTTNGSNTLTWSTASPSSGGGWTDNGVTVYPTTMSDQFLIGTTTVAGLSQLTVEATSTAAIPLTLRGYTGQTANLFQIQNVGGTNLLTVNSAGLITANAGLTVTNGQTFTTNTADINGGAIDGTIIGATAAAAGTFSTVTATTLTDGTASFNSGALTGLTTASSTGLATLDSLKISSTGTTISGIVFGTCTVDPDDGALGDGTATTTTCTATGVATNDKVFVTPANLPASLYLSSASSTADHTIQISIGTATGTTISGSYADWSWMVIK